MLRSLGKIQIGRHGDKTHGIVSLRKVRGEFDRIVRRPASQREALFRRHLALASQAGIYLRQAGPGRRIFRVNGQGLLIQVDGALPGLGRTLAIQVPCVKSKRVCLGIRLLNLWRLTKQRHLQLRHYFRSNLILDGEYVVQCAVIGLRPDVRV